MKKYIAIGALILATAGAQAQTIEFTNLGSFAGLGIVNGTAASNITPLRAHKINFEAGSAGEQFQSVVFSVANFNATTQSVRARIRFYADNAGAPGTYITGFSFNAFSFAPGITNLTGTFTPAPTFAVPASESFWAGITFDNTGTTTGATNTELSNFGMGLFNLPASRGSMTNQSFVTTAAGSFVSSNPAGTLNTYGTNIGGGWSFTTTAVPEPTTMAALGLGSLLIARRRRNKN
jgi:hypothetical protein